MKKILDVFTGEVKSCGNECELVSHAIGSCIVITMYDPHAKYGAMAHVMLPGKAPDKETELPTKYAEDAIDALIRHMDLNPEDHSSVEITLIGGGNVLKRENDTICRKNIQSVKELLIHKKLPISAESLGGTERRSVRFNVETGEVFIRINGSKEIVLWGSQQKDDI